MYSTCSRCSWASPCWCCSSRSCTGWRASSTSRGGSGPESRCSSARRCCCWSAGSIIPSIFNFRFSLYKGTSADQWYGLRQLPRPVHQARQPVRPAQHRVVGHPGHRLLSTVIGIIIARFADRMRGEPIAKALIFLPTAISMVGAGVIWNFVYANNPSKQYGLLNWMWQARPVLPGEQETAVLAAGRPVLRAQEQLPPGHQHRAS